MNSKLITGILIVFLFSEVRAQDQIHSTDSIEIIAKPLNPIFIQQGKRLSLKELTDITKVEPEAHKEIKAAKPYAVVSQIAGGIGGFIIGWQLSSMTSGHKANLSAFGFAAACIGMSIPLARSYSNHAVRAAEIYNSSAIEY